MTALAFASLILLVVGCASVVFMPEDAGDASRTRLFASFVLVVAAVLVTVALDLVVLL